MSAVGCHDIPRLPICLTNRNPHLLQNVLLPWEHRTGLCLLGCQLAEAFTDNLLSGSADNTASPGSPAEHDCSASREQLGLSEWRC